MDIQQPLTLLGGLSAQQFMRRHWQKKPLLIRQAWPTQAEVLPRSQLFELAARDDVESRLVSSQGGAWKLRHGPFARRALPPLQRPDWTLLVQGLDQHLPAMHQLMRAFRFVPDARLDDVMVSYASNGGGVGPHFDSYDVFLLQLAGRRRWRIGAQQDLALRPDLPLKILADFQPEQDFVLEPGDMLYLPPRYAHEGVAVGGDCMTASIGFRAPRRNELARELLQRMAEAAADELTDTLYQDPRQPAVLQPALLPAALQQQAEQAVAQALRRPGILSRALGEYLTEPKAQVWFDSGDEDLSLDQWLAGGGQALRLDARTRMLYDELHVYINGESLRASGRDARLLQQLADARQLDRQQLRGISVAAKAVLEDWCQAGWCQVL